MYTMAAMQPGIAFVFEKFSQISHDPIVCHCVGLDKILRYLKEMVDLSLFYYYSIIFLTIKPVGFADSVYNDDSSNCRFTHSMTMILSLAAYIWNSIKYQII